MIQLEQISKSYNAKTVLFPTDLSILPHEKIAIIGPSGAGKSTLLNIISGAVQPDQGHLFVLNNESSKVHTVEYAHAVGIIRQQFDLIGPLKVVHNVLAGQLSRWGFWKSMLSLTQPKLFPKHIELAKRALNKVGIEDKLFEKTSLLSGGEQQRVAIARLLVQNPKIILADEPVASLDPARSDQIIKMLVTLADENNQVIISSLHSVELAQKYFTRIIGMKSGRIVLDTPTSLLNSTQINELYKLEEQSQNEDPSLSIEYSMVKGCIDHV